MASSTILSRYTQFIFFRLKPSIIPEEAGNREGELFLDILHDATQLSGHVSSAWGRTDEDKNDVVWVIEWADESCSARLHNLSPFIDSSSRSSPLPPPPPPSSTSASASYSEIAVPGIINLFATLTPPISTSSDSLTSHPVTELAPIAFPSTLSPSDQRQWHQDWISLRSVLMEKLPDPRIRAKAFSMGYVERPAVLEHPDSPSGKAVLYMVVVGWESVEQHHAWIETEEFQNAIRPVSDKSLPFVKGLEMRHVRFRKVQ